MVKKIKKGYEIHYKETELSSSSVRELQTSEKLRWITELTVDDNGKINAHEDVICCPYCHKELPAYDSFFSGDFELYHSDVSNFDVNRFLTSNKEKQLSSLYKTLPIDSPIDKNYGAVRCRYCNSELLPSRDIDKAQTIELLNVDTGIIIKHKLESVQELMDALRVAKSINDFSVQLELPYYQVLEFDYDLRTTTVSLLENEKVIDARLITEQDLECECKLNMDCYEMRKFILDSFENHYGIEFNFDLCHFTVKQAMLMNKYGFGSGFYTSLPLDIHTGKIDETFSELFAHCFDAKSLVKYLNDCFNFQISKKLKKIIFEKQSLLFYVDIIKELYEILGPDYLYEILEHKQSPGIVYVLSVLHTRPILLDFFKDFATNSHRKRKLVSLINRNPDAILYYSMEYVVKSEELKKRERQNHFSSIDKHIPDFVCYSRLSFNIDHSIPMNRLEDAINLEGVFKGFHFVVLKNTRECYIAGKALNNCLKEWEPDTNSVIVVEKDNSILAALQVDLRVRDVKQAYLKDNELIPENSDIHKAIMEWAEHNTLVWFRLDEDDEDEEPDLLDLLLEYNEI